MDSARATDGMRAAEGVREYCTDGRRCLSWGDMLMMATMSYLTS
jgi:hypothetical protein